MAQSESEQPYIAILVILVFVALGIATLMLAKYIAGIEGDAVFVVLLLIPVFLYLTITDKLDELKITSGGVSVRTLKKSVSSINDKVTEIGQYEEQRSTYLGKLSQILKTAKILKEQMTLCLIYADVDDLRQHSREIFLKERYRGLATGKRKSEGQIREEIIKELDFALADAFCEEGVRSQKNKKYDIFYLREPDIAMIARNSNVKETTAVAERSQTIFKDRTRYTATIAIVSSNEAEMPRELDKIALERLSRGKKHKRGITYTYTVIV